MGQYPLYKHEPSGGLGAFTPDSFPVCDVLRENVYVIADSNHGFKMIGVGQLVADDILGQRSTILEPFRLSRYAQGNLHPVSHSPFPWSETRWNLPHNPHGTCRTCNELSCNGLRVMHGAVMRLTQPAVCPMGTSCVP